MVTALYRLAGYGVSYFTPGSQFGGEPVMIFLLYRRQRIPGAVCTASVVLDRSLELLADFVFLAAGGLVVANLRLFPSWPPATTIVLPLALLLVPVFLLMTAWLGWKPLTWLLSRVPSKLRSLPRFARLQNLTADAESYTTDLCRRRPLALVVALLLSGLSWAAQIAEYSLSLSFLGLPLGLKETIAAMTAARLAILLPIPGAAGVLEASQVLALQALGYGPAAGISLGLLMRARDLLIAGSGLWIGSLLAAGDRTAEANPVDSARPVESDGGPG